MASKKIHRRILREATQQVVTFKTKQHNNNVFEKQKLKQQKINYIIESMVLNKYILLSTILIWIIFVNKHVRGRYLKLLVSNSNGVKLLVGRF